MTKAEEGAQRRDGPLLVEIRKPQTEMNSAIYHCKWWTTPSELNSVQPNRAEN